MWSLNLNIRCHLEIILTSWLPRPCSVKTVPLQLALLRETQPAPPSRVLPFPSQNGHEPREGVSKLALESVRGKGESTEIWTNFSFLIREISMRIISIPMRYRSALHSVQSLKQYARALQFSRPTKVSHRSLALNGALDFISDHLDTSLSY